jgi:hypothetical protein
MTRIPSHSIEDAPQAARSLLAEMVQFSPTGRLLSPAGVAGGGTASAGPAGAGPPAATSSAGS